MNSSRRTAELYPISALEVLGHFGWRSEQPALHAVDGRLRLGAHVGEVALALADQHGGDLAAVAAEERDLQGGRVHAPPRRVLPLGRDDLLPARTGDRPPWRRW